MRIRKVSEPFKHLSGEPVKVVSVNDFESFFNEPSTVIPISKAAEYAKRNNKVVNS